MSSRTATKKRSTAETQIELRLDLDGEGDQGVETGVGFLDHMLDLLARHGRLGLKVEASGDLETGAHHTVEDVGIVLGQALDEALGDRSGIRRYGSALVPMDESLAECAIDISGRPYCAFDADLPTTSIAWPSTMPTSSTVWWLPVSRSPVAFTCRPNRPWRARRSSM